VVGVFNFSLLRAEKRDKRWLISMDVARVFGVLVVLFLDLVFDLVCELVLSCYGLECVVHSIELSLLVGRMDGSNLSMKVFLLCHSLPKP